MNLLQALLDIASLINPTLKFTAGIDVAIAHYPSIVNAFGAMPHFSAAADALFEIPPSFLTFRRELKHAWEADEFVLLGQTLLRLGYEAGFKMLQTINLKLWTGLDAGLIFGRSLTNIWSLATEERAGFIMFYIPNQ